MNIKKRIVQGLFLVAMVMIAAAGLAHYKDGGNVRDSKERIEEVDSEEENDVSLEASWSKDLFAMDTYMTLTAYGSNASQALEDAAKEITKIENLVSTGIASSEIGKLNKNGEQKVSEDTAALIQKSMELYQSTEGAFDITVYPVMKLWGFADQNYKVPSKEALSQALNLMGANQIHFDEKTSQVTFVKNGMEIDLGGIAKGYTSGKVMEIFQKDGIKSGIINLGGNVHTLGTKSDGSKWKVAIENPDGSGNYLGVVSAADKAVITSGGYERYFEEDGKRYHHIIDPSTGYPAQNGLSSVSIVSSDGALADGLSTSLYIMGKEKALDYWRKHTEEFDAVLVEENGGITITKGICEDFTSDFAFEIAKG